MNCLPIDENSCIIQPYYDGSESYVGNHKYSVVPQYKTIPEGAAKQTWEAMLVHIEARGQTEAKIENLNIDISDYTYFRLFSRISKGVNVKIYCNDELVLDKPCNGKIEQIDSEIVTTQKTIKTIKYVFENNNDVFADAVLHYLGMTNDKPKNKNNFTAEWEGFFEENPSVELFDENLISKEELIKLRENISREPFASLYKKAKETAQEAMKKEPEKQIKRTVSDFFREPNNISGLVELALVGQIEQNKDMLKMACRCALSLGCCEYWCCDPMETVPTVTWHHRSFTESEIARHISTVISLCGNLLTWHGRNFLYNMIIMKALPRMEADFMTMEYIYHMNQGIAFMSGYVQALTTLAKNYPRFDRRVKESEILLNEMLENAFESDGSSFEGAGYWQYTVMNYLYSVYFLARYNKKDIGEYVGHRLDKISDFGLSLVNSNGIMISVNDVHPGVYTKTISALLYAITDDDRWAKIYHKDNKSDEIFSMFMINSVDVPKLDTELTREFIYKPIVGYTQVSRNGIHFFGNSGPSNDTHCHYDKGSFIVYKNGNPVIPDVTALYTDAEAGRLQLTQSHSLAIPVDGDILLEQNHGDGFGAYTEKATFENGVFEWCSNNSEMWDNTKVLKNIRYVKSEKPNEFVITDEFVFTKPMSVSFRLNMTDKNTVQVDPVNWKPISKDVVQLYKTDEETDYQLILTSEKANEIKLVTKITIC